MKISQVGYVQSADDMAYEKIKMIIINTIEIIVLFAYNVYRYGESSSMFGKTVDSRYLNY